MTLSLKIQFENSTKKSFEFKINCDAEASFYDQQKKFFDNDNIDVENKYFYHLFNLDTNLFILSLSDIKSSK